MDQFREVELFVQVAECASISRAAEALGLSTSAASRYLAALEARLGVSLIERTTRRLFLTEAGLKFNQRCKAVLADLREAEAVAKEMVVSPAGQIRVMASLSFCLLHITPMLPAFTARYPEINVDMVASNRYYDIIENGVDVAIRTREFEADSNITVRRLARTRRVLAAAPAYLARHGIPASPQALAQHQMLVYAYANDPNELPFERDGQRHVAKIKPLLAASDGQILRHAALDGMGILVQPKYIIHDDLLAGRLVSVLDDWELPHLTMNIAFQTRANVPAKARVFIDALVERFETHDFERLWTS